MNCKYLIFSCSLFLFGLPTFAATGKIIKVQGTRAVVQFDQIIKTGDVVKTIDSIADNVPENILEGQQGPGLATRNYAFEYNLALTSSSGSGSTGTSFLLQNAGWWFNYHQYEIAALGGFSSSGNLTQLAAGVQAQWDFIKNNVGVRFVPAGYGKLALGNSSLGGSSSSNYLIGLGGSMDWFPFFEHAAINVSVEFDIISGSNSTINQFAVLSGPKIYF